MSEAVSKTRSAFAETPGYRIDFEPCHKRVRTVFEGETLADSTAVRLLHETRHLPVYYFGVVMHTTCGAQTSTARL